MSDDDNFGFPKIERGVPIPKLGGRSYVVMDLLRAMNVGDSFWIPATQVAGSFHSSMHKSAKRLGMRVMIRSTEEEDIDGYRVWRVR